MGHGYDFANELQATADPVFNFLLEEAIAGSVPAYIAEVSFKLLQRWDLSHRPLYTDQQLRVMKHLMRLLAEQSQMMSLWVYPRHNKLIVSKYELLLGCYEVLKPEKLHVVHLLTPDKVLPAHGPLPNDQVRSRLIAINQLVNEAAMA